MEDSTKEVLPPQSDKKTDRKFSNIRLIKNLIAVSVSCFLCIGSYDALLLLQSTMNKEKGIGTVSVAIQFITSCLTAILLPKYLIQRFGCKTTVVVCLAMHVPYIAANFYPHWILMIFTSIAVGMANSLYWGAQSYYLNNLSILYSKNIDTNMDEKKHDDLPNCDTLKSQETMKISNPKIQAQEEGKILPIEVMHCKNYKNHPLSCDNKPIKATAFNSLPEFGQCSVNSKTGPNSSERRFETSENTSNYDKNQSIKSSLNTVEIITPRFFGIHGFIFQSCHIWCNLVSYYILRNNSLHDSFSRNSTCVCGIEFCGIENECVTQNLKTPETSLRYILVGTFVLLSSASVIIAGFFVDQLNNKDKVTRLTSHSLLATCRLIKTKKMLCLIPMFLFIGVAQGFIFGDLTKDYIACAWGIEHVGLVLAFFGGSLSFFCPFSGWLVKHAGRKAVFLFAAITQLASIVILFQWLPDPSKPAMFFTISGLWGASLGILWSQLRAFYGVIFKGNEEEAFANYQLWHALGVGVVFIYNNLVCTDVKVSILTVVFVLGMIGYMLAERSYAQES